MASAATHCPPPPGKLLPALPHNRTHQNNTHTHTYRCTHMQAHRCTRTPRHACTHHTHTTDGQKPEYHNLKFPLINARPQYQYSKYHSNQTLKHCHSHGHSSSVQTQQLNIAQQLSTYTSAKYNISAQYSTAAQYRHSSSVQTQQVSTDTAAQYIHISSI